ncbi:MAG: hypothetical protein HYZ14_16295 [Bacteroidetes bacterium]|nr:hypothetical protein [Bacteroidota bacterium]
MSKLQLNKSTAVKQMLSILIPLIGVLFLDWNMIKVLAMFQLELLAIYLAYYISYYMLDSKTKFPFVASAFMLLLSIPVILIILVLQFCILYGFLELNTFTLERAVSHGVDEFFDQVSWSVLIYFTLLELAYQRLEKQKNPHHYYVITHAIFRRLFMSNLYLLVVCIPALFLENSLFFAVPVLIGFKFVMEFTGEGFFFDKTQYK